MMERETVDIEALAEEVSAKFHMKCLSGTEELLWYDEMKGVYRRGGEFKVKEYLEQHVKGLTTHIVNEVLGHVQRANYVDLEAFDSDPRIFNVRNGLLDIDAYTLTEHTPTHLSLVQLPVNYDPTATCPRIMKFLSEVVRPEDIPTLQEFVGYCLWKDYPSHKAIMLVGDGNNGKSTFLHIVKQLLGAENVAAVSLHELESNRFAKADLHGKLANIYADLDERALQSAGVFKMLTGQDPIRAEFKFGRSFTFVNYAKLMFSANRVPEVYEDSDAFFRRWLIFNFPNTFQGDREDKELKQKLTTDEELSGFLNWALDGLKRLRNNHFVFSNSKSIQETREDYIRRSSPIRAFLTYCVERTNKAEDFVSKADFYAAFVKYCRLANLTAVGKDSFFTNLAKYEFNVAQEKKRQGERRYWALVGVKIKPENEWFKSESDGESWSNGSEGSNVSLIFNTPSSLKQDEHNVRDEHGAYTSSASSSSSTFLLSDIKNIQNHGPAGPPGPEQDGPCELCGKYGSLTKSKDGDMVCSECLKESYAQESSTKEAGGDSNRPPSSPQQEPLCPTWMTTEAWEKLSLDEKLRILKGEDRQ